MALVDDARIRALNRQYRRLDRATDVLAFPQQVPGLLGDVVISVETAARRAGPVRPGSHGAGPAPGRLHQELVRYLLHGILHLLGWDHHAPADRGRMRRQEQVLWRVAWDDRR